jgi:monoamine oxidase
MTQSPLMWSARRATPRVELTERRDFLKAAALAGAGAMLAPGAFAQRAGRDSTPRVIVVGAGLAGLSCAYELRSAGVDVVVYEARERVGGRVISIGDIIPGKIVEGGGEFIGANQPRWIGYAEQFGIALRPSEPEDADQLERPILVNGRYLPKPDANRVWESMAALTANLNAPARKVIAHEPWASAGAATLDQRTVAQWLAEQDADGVTKTLVRASLEAECGVELEQMSMLALLAKVAGGGLEDYWAHNADFRAVGGAQSLATAFADRMKGRVVLRTPVTKIVTTPGRAGVLLSDGKFVRGDTIVLALPPSVWKKIHFEAGDADLPALQMGLATKLIAIAPDAFWKRLASVPFGLTDTDTQMIWGATAGQDGPASADPRQAMTGYSGGPSAERIRAVDRPTRDGVMTRAMAQLWPGETEGAQFVRYIDWRNDPWAMAGFSFPAPGQVTTVCKALREPIGALRFAGEHCSTAFPGTMEGALESGARTAREILAGG